MLDLLSSINLDILFIQGFDSQIKTLLATALKRHNADLGEFVELFYGKLVCSCEPYLRGGEKSLWKTYLSIAQYVYCGIKSSLMLVSSILSQLYSLENLCLIFFSFSISPPSPSFPCLLLAGGHLPYGLYQVWKCVGDFISKWIQKRASTPSEMTFKWFY